MKYHSRFLVVFALLWTMCMAAQARAPRLSAAERQQLSTILQQTDTNLRDSVLPFWAKTWDEKNGGFNTVVDRFGKPLAEAGATDKRLIMQARMVWALSASHQYGIRDKGYLELAGKGVKFITEKMWDAQNDGFFMSVAPDGTPVDDNKYTYAHSFVIYALCEYSMASGDKNALNWAEKTFDLLQKKTGDGRWGYTEDFDRKWRMLPLSIGVLNGRAGKTLNTHMHLMEAFTLLSKATRQRKHRDALRRITQLIVDKIIDPRYGFAREPFDFNWNPVSDDRGLRSVYYGHDVELAWLLTEAAREAGLPAGAMRKTSLRLIDHALLFGFDWKNGGIATRGSYFGHVEQTAPYNENMRKSWWEQAENLVATSEAFEATGQRRYLQAFGKQWSWIWKYQIDHEAGDWYAETDWKTGEPISLNKGHYGWKAAYHNSRALMRVSQTLRRILGKTP